MNRSLKNAAAERPLTGIDRPCDNSRVTRVASPRPAGQNPARPLKLAIVQAGLTPPPPRGKMFKSGRGIAAASFGFARPGGLIRAAASLKIVG